MEELSQPLASFEVKRNAKGEWAFEVKCRANEGETDVDVAQRVEAIADRFNAQYPVKVKDADSTDK